MASRQVPVSHVAAKNSPGYVYVLTNPSFKDDWVKIGKSGREVDVRSKELDNTAVPLPFDIFATLKTSKYNQAEKFIHKMIDMVAPDIRIRKGREFFNITPKKAYEILKLCAEQYDDAEIEIYDEDLLAEVDAHPSEEATVSSPKAARLTFGMVGIPIGSQLVFHNPGNKARPGQYEDITVTVVDNANTVRLDSENGDEPLELSLSAAAREISRRLGTMNKSASYQGSLWFTYNGESLTSIRKRLNR